MPTYFGYNVQGAVDQADTNKLWWINPDTGTASYRTCPGSGDQLVNELTAWVSGTTGHNFRIGIYSHDGSTLICQTPSTSTGDPKSWKGVTSAANIDPSNTTLVGGTEYILCFHAQDSSVYLGSTSGVSTDGMTASQTYASGLPASLSGSTANYLYSIRCGVSVVATAAITGTVTESIGEEDIVSGGKTVIITLTGDEFISD